MGGRSTGPGKIDVRSRSSVAILSASLYNFDIDGDEPKGEHYRWLDEHVVPLLAGASHYVWMRGFASRTASDAHNIRLSRRRVERVAKYLEEKGAVDWQMQTDWVGESLSRSINEEDEGDRAVEVRVQPIGPESQERSKPPPKPPPPPPVSPQFALRVQFEGQHSRKPKGRLARILRKLPRAGLVTESMIVDIRDRRNPLTARYIYLGEGFGIGWPKQIPVNATLPGDWNEFSTSKPIHVSQFDGFARFTSIGQGNVTWNYIYLGGTPKGVDGVYMPIETGYTILPGGSTTVGALILLEVKPVGPDGRVPIRTGPERRVPVRTGP